MKLRFALISAFIAASSIALLGSSYVAFEQIAVANSAIGFTASKITPSGAPGQSQAVVASCRLETAEVRYTVDGTTPTTTVGTLLEVGEILTVQGHDSMLLFKAIRTGATSGQLDCVYSTP